MFLTRNSNFVPLLIQVINKPANFRKVVRRTISRAERRKKTPFTVVDAESEMDTDNYYCIEIKKKTISV